MANKISIIDTKLSYEKKTITGMITNNSSNPVDIIMVKDKSGNVISIIDNIQTKLENWHAILIYNDNTNTFMYHILSNSEKLNDLGMQIPPSKEILSTGIRNIWLHFAKNPLQRVKGDCFRYGILFGTEIQQSFDIKDAKTEIDRINKLLQEQCFSYSLKFDYTYNMDGQLHLYNLFNYKLVTLCLYYNGNCISSIQIDSAGGPTISIDSKTSTQHERNQFNTLLRSVVIMIASKIKYNGTNITEIYSCAISPVSAYLLLLKFKGTLTEPNVRVNNNRTLYNNSPKNTPLTKEFIEKYYEKNNAASADIIIKVTDKEVVDNAEAIFNSIIPKYKLSCPPEQNSISSQKGGSRKKTKRHTRQYKKTKTRKHKK